MMKRERPPSMTWLRASGGFSSLPTALARASTFRTTSMPCCTTTFLGIRIALNSAKDV